MCIRDRVVIVLVMNDLHDSANAKTENVNSKYANAKNFNANANAKVNANA